MSFENIVVERHGKVAQLTLNRPKALNALNRKTLEELTRAFAEFAADRGLAAVIVTGAGEKAFVAGADISEMANMKPSEAAAFAALGHALGSAIARAPQIVIAAVNGFALGGGCELACACDFIYASETAKFGQPEVNLAVVPGFGGTQTLPRRVGTAMALEMVCAADPITAAEALRIGLVNRVVPASELLPVVRATAEKIAAKGPLAVAAAKRAIRATLDTHLQDGVKLEIEAFGSCFATADQKEGMAAFLAKRPPVFNGQ